MNGFPEPVPRPGPGPRPQKATGNGQRQHHQQHRHATEQAWNLSLESIGGRVAGRFLTESPSVAVLVVEDLCWQAGTRDWRRRRPHWWRRRALAAWRAEGALLDAKAVRLRELADEVFKEL